MTFLLALPTLLRMFELMLVVVVMVILGSLIPLIIDLEQAEPLALKSTILGVPEVGHNLVALRVSPARGEPSGRLFPGALLFWLL